MKHAAVTPARPARGHGGRAGDRACLLLLSLLGTWLLAAASFPAAAAAPGAKGFRVVTPTSRVLANETPLAFYTYWDSAHYQVSADLSLLDDTATTPVTATYAGDSSIVVGGVVTDVWSVYRIETAIGAGNTRADGAGIVLPVTAVNPTLNESTTLQSLSFCLLNDPPTHVSSLFVGPAERFVEVGERTYYQARNGDSLRIETTWSFGARPLLLETDFSAVDARFDPAGVFYWLSGPNGNPETYSIYYELSDSAHGASTEILPIRIDVTDGACGSASTTLELLIDNEGPNGAPRFIDLPDTVLNADLRVSGYAPADAREVLLLLDQSARYSFLTQVLGDSLIFEGTITLAPGLNRLVAYGVDAVGNRSTAAAEHELVFNANAPDFKGFTVVEPDSLHLSRGKRFVRNGDWVNLRLYFDSRVRYEVTADFSRIDSGGDPALPATQIADLDTLLTSGETEVWSVYTVDAQISPDNLLADDGQVPIPIAARDPISGQSAISEDVRFCLYNNPLMHRGTWVVGDSARYIDRDGVLCYRVRNGEPLKIHTRWSTINRPMSIAPDFIQLDQLWAAGDAAISLVGEVVGDTLATYQILYTLNRLAWPSSDTRPRYPVPVFVEGRDSECGAVQTILYFEMDLDGPTSAPIFSPALPAQVTAGTLSLAGQAPGGDAVDLLVEVVHLDAPDPDSTSTIILALDAAGGFAGSIALVEGRNEVTAYSRDLVGNRSPASISHVVVYLTQARITIPQPFTNGEAFVFETPAGWSRAQVEIFTLEGDRVRSWDRAGSGGLLHQVSIDWDGRNERGEWVRQGPYLLRYRMHDGSGRTAIEEVKAFVFKK